MTFIRYPHLERLGHQLVNGIEDGECWVFPKLDGTNASLWYEPKKEEGFQLRAGSRNRVLTLEQDNAGFLAWALSEDPHALSMVAYLGSFPIGTRFYGEWLVPHTIQSYRDDAWRKFWLFDVWVPGKGFLPFMDYQLSADLHLTVVQPFAKIINPTEADIRKFVDSNTYLIKDGEGFGEGVVVKRYDFQNYHSQTTWAKVVRNEFKEDNRLAFGVAERDGSYQPELDMVEHAVTKTLVDKERAKIVLDLENQGITPVALRKILIPRLLGTMFHVLVTEELWSELKRLNNPTIDFRKLHRLCIVQTKKFMGDLL